jgi:hypothetical protein
LREAHSKPFKSDIKGKLIIKSDIKGKISILNYPQRSSLDRECMQEEVVVSHHPPKRRVKPMIRENC